MRNRPLSASSAADARPSWLAHSISCLFLLFTSLLIATATTAWGGTFTAFGPETFARLTGTPEPVVRSFTVLNPDTEYVLRVIPQGPRFIDGEGILVFRKGANFVIKLNGVRVVGMGELHQTFGVLERDVDLDSTNELSVQMKGKPGTRIRVEITGVDEDDPTISATIDPSPNLNGWNNSDVTVLFDCDDPTSGIASCTEPVVVSTEGSGQSITGTAIDQVGRSASVIVTLNIDKTPPEVFIFDPPGEAATTEDSIEVSGTISEPAVVRVADSPETFSTFFFSVTVPLREGNNLLPVSATDLADNTTTVAVVVLRDTTAPQVSILTPRGGALVGGSTTTVVGVVQDLLIGTVNAGDCTVTVNGVAAEVARGGFAARNVPVARGSGTITAIARDRVGNTDVAVIPVIGDPGPKAEIVTSSGGSQSGPIRSELPAPLVTLVVDNARNPVPGVPVTFRVTRGNGFLSNGGRDVTVTSDVNGRASTILTLGSRAGAASDLVEAEAPGFFGMSVFFASATATPDGPRILAPVDGASQRGASGDLAPEPLTVLLTDESGNPVSGEQVTFTVQQGGGQVNGAAVTTVTTDDDGRAFGLYTLGLEIGVNSQQVEASAIDADPVFFVASTVQADAPGQTAVSGVCLTNDNLPITGVEVSVVGAGLPTLTDVEGRFLLSSVPSGQVHLLVDGTTAGPYPTLEFEFDVIAGVDNTMNRPIYLPVLDSDGIGVANPTTDIEITREDTPGFQMVIPAGSATFPGGQGTGTVQVIRVNLDKIPMPPPDGTIPLLAFAILPPTVEFDPPAPIRFPNVEGREPGELLSIFSFNHDVGQFVVVGTAQVTEDGTFVESEPGQGIVKGGWHITPAPTPVETCVDDVCGFTRSAVCGTCVDWVNPIGPNPCAAGTPYSCNLLAPDMDCWPDCPPGSENWNSLCPTGNPDPANTPCIRGCDDTSLGGAGFTGVAGTCQYPAGPSPICCPNGNWCTPSIPSKCAHHQPYPKCCEKPCDVVTGCCN